MYIIWDNPVKLNMKPSNIKLLLYTHRITEEEIDNFYNSLDNPKALCKSK